MTGAVQRHTADPHVYRAEQSTQSSRWVWDDDLPEVRDAIAASWRRSELLGLDRSQLEPRASESSTTDDEILRRVDAVLSRNAERLTNEPITIVFATPDGSIIQRICGDSDMRRQLDSVHLAPGSGYDEQTMGTNGIGTAAEVAVPILVHGREHYNEKLSVFTCAGQPVFHPLTGALVGIVDITCYARDATGLLMATAGAIADQIEQALTETINPAETQLLREYLVACQHTSSPVIAQGNELVMMNRHAQQLLTPEDRSSLLTHSGDFIRDSLRESVVADLPSGLSARLTYKPTTLNGQVVGGIIRVRLDNHRHSESAPVRHQTLSGLVGSSAEWLRACGTLVDHARQGASVIVAGEPGAGRSAVTRAVHDRVFPSERLAVLDCTESRNVDAFVENLESELSGRAPLLLRKIDTLDEQAISAVSELLLEHRSGPAESGPRWIAATCASGEHTSGIDSAVIPIFDHSVTIPPLRHRPEDIAPLATHLLRRFDREGRVRFDDVSLRHLARLPWYGNIIQLQSVIRDSLQHKRTGVIGIDDLPAECDSSIRRSLTPIEAIQRDAIVDALRIHQGHKLAAAEHLGMSRATIYRKIREFGIAVRHRTSRA